MKKTLILGSLALVTLGGAFAYAQQERGPNAERPRFEMSREDRQAMLDGRIAGAKAMLRLTSEQEKLWGPVEASLRETATRRLELREQRRAQRGPGNDRPAPEPDPIKRMRDGAARLQEGATAMGKMAEASAPLYASLDEAQKRRFTMLLRQGMRGGDRMGYHHRGGPGYERGPHGGPEHRGGGRL